MRYFLVGNLMVWKNTVRRLAILSVLAIQVLGIIDLQAGPLPVTKLCQDDASSSQDAKGKTVGQPDQEKKFTRAQRLRGSVTPQRAWWDVLHYDLSVQIDHENKTFGGKNAIRFKATEDGQRMQIDMQQPMELTLARWLNESATDEATDLSVVREGNVYWLDFPQPIRRGTENTIELTFSGQPTEAKHAPWDGGVVWAVDKKKRPWIATACQGIGASTWWPCKDHGGDEPDHGIDIRITTDEDLVGVANGRLVEQSHDQANQLRTFHWRVVNPINHYGVAIQAGHYVTFEETYEGPNGALDMSYWTLDYQKERAIQQFAEAPRVIEAFEYWFGKYPFYDDGYKLVEVPYLGMEHQSSVTYGNGFANGYAGRDLSGTGVGLRFDFIIVHESGHEWFGNNISMIDSADMWIHESFTNYAECLFVEYHFDEQQAADYVIGCRRNVLNDRPIIAPAGVNARGSGDMYYKGGNMLHMIRQMVGDTQRWREILRKMNRRFRHQTVTTRQIEQFLIDETGLALQLVFDQYLRTTDIPVLEYEIDGSTLRFRYRMVVEGFAVPLPIRLNRCRTVIRPNCNWQEFRFDQPIKTVKTDRNYYVMLQKPNRR